ncbi:MAG: AarF/ABC1/UbiB kinase family protein [Nitrospirae bacterium]|nr:AarF/ABC1/UbiB kinase family protein [Nitrospirota bacterium]
MKLADLNRLRKILVIVFESGGGLLVDRLRLKYLVPLWSRVRRWVSRPPSGPELMRMEGVQPMLSPPVLRSVLERLGPTFVKLGQVLSLRADLVGEELSAELSKLHSDVPPFPYETARRIVKEELGAFPEDLFGSFEDKPTAAASLAQVHRAFFKDGTEVAVKIQRPGIRKTIEQDIHILYYLAGLTERFVPEWRIYRPTSIVKEFADWTLRELDFSAEGRNAERFRFIFKENPSITIPKIYWEFTTPRILTMEFSHGVKSDEIERVRAFGVDTKQLASIGVDAFFRQFFIAGVFHADPHPGNFFVMPNGSLCLHDFGMVGYLDQASRRELLSCLVAFVNKDIEGYYRHLLHMAIVDDARSDVVAFQKDVAGILSEFFFADRPPSVAWAFFRVINQGAQNGIRFPGDLALFGKALVTTEAMGLKLHPGFNITEELEPFVKKALIEYCSPKKVWQRVKTDFLDAMGALTTFPERVQNVLTKIERGEIGVKLDAGDLQGIKKEFDRQNDLRILGIVLTAVVFATLGLLYLEGRTTLWGVPLSRLGIGASLVLAAWFVVRLSQGPRE